MTRIEQTQNAMAELRALRDHVASLTDTVTRLVDCCSLVPAERNALARKAIAMAGELVAVRIGKLKTLFEES